MHKSVSTPAHAATLAPMEGGITTKMDNWTKICTGPSSNN